MYVKLFHKTKKSASLRYFNSCIMHNIERVFDRLWHDSLSMYYHVHIWMLTKKLHKFIHSSMRVYIFILPSLLVVWVSTLVEVPVTFTCSGACFRWTPEHLVSWPYKKIFNYFFSSCVFLLSSATSNLIYTPINL